MPTCENRIGAIDPECAGCLRHIFTEQRTHQVFLAGLELQAEGCRRGDHVLQRDLTLEGGGLCVRKLLVRALQH